MEITSIGYSPRPIDLARVKAPTQPANGFGEMLTNALQDVNQLQRKSDDLSSRLALGKDVEVHEAVLAAEEAGIAFQYSMQVRNKLIEAYQEVMRMQV